MSLSVDRAVCISCGMCAERLPAIFCIDRTLHAAKMLRQPQKSEQDDALEVVEDCPAGAIVVHFPMAFSDEDR